MVAQLAQGRPAMRQYGQKPNPGIGVGPMLLTIQPVVCRLGRSKATLEASGISGG